MTFIGAPGVLPEGHMYLVTSEQGRFINSCATRGSMYDIMRKHPGSRMWRYQESAGGFAWVEIAIRAVAAKA